MDKGLLSFVVKRDELAPVKIVDFQIKDFEVIIKLSNVMRFDKSKESVKEYFSNSEMKWGLDDDSNNFFISVPRIDPPSFYKVHCLVSYLINDKNKWVLGINDYGPFEIDLDKFIHGFVCGSTGYGKSTLFKLLLAQTLAFKSEFVNHVIDPKRVEFELYEKHPRIGLMASNTSQTLALLHTLIIEIEMRKHIFQESFKKSPKNIIEYKELKKEYKRYDLPDLPRHIIWVDEAHAILDTDGYSRNNIGSVFNFIARIGRSFGIHLMLCSQKDTDIPSTLRMQMNLGITFFIPGDTSYSSFFKEGTVSRVDAIRGRCLTAFENKNTRNIQVPLLSDEELLTMAYFQCENVKKFENFGFYRANINNEAFNNRNFYSDIINVGLLKAVQNAIDSSISRNSEVDFSSEIVEAIHGSELIELDLKSNIESEVIKDIIEKRKEFIESCEVNDFKSIKDFYTSILNETDEIFLELIYELEVIEQEAFIASKNRVMANEEFVKTARNLFETYSKNIREKYIKYEAFKQTHNELEIESIVNEYKGIYTNYKKDQFDWCKRDLHKNKVLNNLYEAYKKIEITLELEKNLKIKIEELALSQKNRSKLEKYIEDFSESLKSTASSPLLILYGKKGVGKNTILTSLAQHLNLPIRDSKKSDILIDIDANGLALEMAPKKEDEKEEINERDEIVVFYEYAAATAFIKKPKGNIHPIYVAEPSNEDIFMEKMTGYSVLKESLKYLKEYNILLELRVQDFREREILEKLINSLLKKYKFDFDSVNGDLVKDITESRMNIIPNKVEAIIQRAANRALNTKKDFNYEILKEILSEFHVMVDQKENQSVDVINPSKSFNDLILNDEIKGNLYDAVVYAKSVNSKSYQFINNINPKERLTLLFGGPPGTGKTLSAEVLAKELGKSLWVLSLARVQGSLVGETEKLIENVFIAAQASEAVLLIDECESLLKDRSLSNNSYENRIINHLLVLIEKFKGVLVLTTNYAGNIDNAFSRRIDFKLNFDLPGEEQKYLILKGLLEPDAPLEKEVNLKAVVLELPLSGGLIKLGVQRAVMKMVSGGNVHLSEYMLRKAMEETVNEELSSYSDSKRIGL